MSEKEINSNETIKEYFILNKELFKIQYEEYEKLSDRIYKLFPAITFILGADGYIIKELINAFKNSCVIYWCFFFIVFIIMCLLFLTIGWLFYFIIKSLKHRETSFMQMDEKHLTMIKDVSVEVLHKRLCEEFIEINKKNYTILKEKSKNIKDTFLASTVLIICSIVLFITYLFFLIINPS